MTLRDITSGLLGAIYVSGIWLLFSVSLHPTLGAWLLIIWGLGTIGFLVYLIIESYGKKDK